MTIRRTMFIVATALCAAAGAAAAASPEAAADPNWYSTLSCSCTQVPGVESAIGDQVNAGIADGLAQLQGISG